MGPRILLYIAGSVLVLHSLMEFAALPSLFRFKPGTPASGHGVPAFVFEPLQTNLRATMAIGVIFGVLRLAAAIGIFLNLVWGLWLGATVSVVTLVVKTLYLPIGVIDGILSSAALILPFIAFFGSRAIL